METGVRAKPVGLPSGFHPCARLSRLICSQNLVSYERGSAIHREGSAVADLLYVHAGIVRVSMPYVDGSRFTVHLVGPGEVFACATPGGHVQPFEAHAFTRCSLGFVRREEMWDLVRDEDAPVLIKVLESMDALCFSLLSDLVAFLGMTYRERLLKVIGNLAGRLGVKESRGVLIVPELSDRDFAELIGSSPLLARRLLLEMAEQGIITRDGRRCILNAPEPTA